MESQLEARSLSGGWHRYPAASHAKINHSRQFSTTFQFGELVGVGAEFSREREYDVGLRVQHVSNGGIRNPNDGLTYGSLVFQYRFR